MVVTSEALKAAQMAPHLVEQMAAKTVAEMADARAAQTAL